MNKATANLNIVTTRMTNVQTTLRCVPQLYSNKNNRNCNDTHNNALIVNKALTINALLLADNCIRLDGECRATAWTMDLREDYTKINDRGLNVGEDISSAW